MPDSKQADESKTTRTTSITQSGSNSRGIPAAIFIDDVPSYLLQHHIDPESLLKQLQQLYGKYKFMENSLITQKKALYNKIPDIQAALSSVTYLKHKKDNTTTTSSSSPFNVQFELADNVYINANIDPKEDTVLLWLGANVMLAYNYDEAYTLLTNNLKNAEISLTSLSDDLAFLKDQITISEVNIARVHNENVTRRQQLQQQQVKQLTK